MFERIYIEIGNICNLNCSFCQKSNRAKRQMTINEFSEICKKVKPHTKYIYLHVLGEPLLHNELTSFLKIANENGLLVCITTNGTLLAKRGQIILDNALTVHKVSVSLHAPEANQIKDYTDYLKNAATFAKAAAKLGIFVVFRLWNKDTAAGLGKNSQNGFIVDFLKGQFKEEWQVRPKGFRLNKNIFLEFDGVFTWPSESKAEKVANGFCYGLSSQLAILCDGTVVPCCLDANGNIPLGNIFNESLEEVINSKLSKDIYEGFKAGKIVHPFCQKCTFNRKFKKRNN